MLINFSLIAVISFFLSFFYIRLSRRLSIIDEPNHRSSHSIPTPRGAGVVLILVFTTLLTQSVMPFREQLLLTLPIMFGVLGFVDDFWSLSSKLRFALYALLLAVFWFFFMVGTVSESKLLFVFLLSAGLWFVSLWWVNLYNFMDGINGLALTQALFALLSIYFLAESSDYNELMLFMIAALLGVLLWNFPKARVFLGDSGSLFLATLLLLMAVMAKIPFLVFVILMAVFIADSTYTLIVRLFSGKNIFSAHRDHAYQKLAMKYQSHTKVTLACVVYNICYLLPIAFFVFNQSLLVQLLAVLLSYLPLLIVLVKTRAGLPFLRE